MVGRAAPEYIQLLPLLVCPTLNISTQVMAPQAERPEGIATVLVIIGSYNSCARSTMPKGEHPIHRVSC